MRIWYPLIVYMLVQAFTPGPNNLTCLYLGASYGLRGCLKFMAASMISLTVKHFLCGTLNLFLARYIPGVMNWLKWIGAAYMVYLAVMMALSGWRESFSVSGQQSESTYRAGILLQVLNVKSWIAAVSAFAVYVIPHTATMTAIVLVSAVALVIYSTASASWAAFGSLIRKLIFRCRKPFGIVMGLSLLYCAVTAVLP